MLQDLEEYSENFSIMDILGNAIMLAQGIQCILAAIQGIRNMRANLFELRLLLANTP